MALTTATSGSNAWDSFITNASNLASAALSVSLFPPQPQVVQVVQPAPVPAAMNNPLTGMGQANNQKMIVYGAIGLAVIGVLWALKK